MRPSRKIRMATPGARIALVLGVLLTSPALVLSSPAAAATPAPTPTPVETTPVEEPAPIETTPVEESAPEAPQPSPTAAESPAPTATPEPSSTPQADEPLTPERMDRIAGDVTEDAAIVDDLIRATESADVPGATGGQGGPEARTLVGFRAAHIVSDSVFYAGGDLTVGGAQAFLDEKARASFTAAKVTANCPSGKVCLRLGSGVQQFNASQITTDCAPGYTCLSDFRQTTPTRGADAYCASYQGASNETAAQIIVKVAKACGISAKALVVMLQKEQGLVTHIWPSDFRYRSAMGMGCPDTAACDSRYYGFFNQVYGGARQLKVYGQDSFFNWYPVGRSSQVGYHPNASCGSSAVTIENKATAALYYYTPYQPNAAALAAGYGEGDACSSYGNRNFYNYYTDWFGSVGPTDPCAVPSGVSSAHRQYVTTAVLNARKAPSTSCQDGSFTLQAGTILQALRVTADGSWIEVTTLEGRRWVSRDFLRYANASEGECTLPAGSSGAHRQYVVRAATSAKVAPWAGCTMGSATFTKGTVLQATRVSATGKWLEVATKAGPRWVSRDALAYATASDIASVCTDPAGTSSASRQYVLRASAQTWVSPVPGCAVGTSLGAGSVLQATRLSASGLWLEVLTQAGPRWVAREAVAYASDGDMAAACTAPAGTSSSADRFVATASTRGWVSPFLRCGTGSREIGAGTVLQATRISSSGAWVQVRTAVGDRWVSRDAVTQCADPVGTAQAYKRYVVRESTQALVSPLAECGTAAKNWGAGTSPRPVGVGTVLQATRVSASGKWLEVQTAAGNRWVPSAAIEQCAEPAGTRAASRQYVVRKTTDLVVSPLAECGTAAVNWGAGTSPQAAAVGTVVQATRVSASGKWLEVATQTGRRWIARDAVDYATAADVTAVCVDPAGTKPASKTYVLEKTVLGWVSPLPKCGSGATSLGAGTQLRATRVSASGLWLEVATSAGPRWIWRADARQM